MPFTFENMVDTARATTPNLAILASFWIRFEMYCDQVEVGVFAHFDLLF